MRARGCLVALGVALAIGAAVAAVLGPGLLRRAREGYAPVSRMKGEQREFETWTRGQHWQEPASPTLDARTLESFLALRDELRRLDDKGASLRGQRPSRRPRLDEVPSIMEGGGGLVSQRLAAFRPPGITADEYDYLERLVYTSWLRPLIDRGEDPAARERAARVIEEAA